MENVDKAEEPANINIECPAISENSACPCYKFEDGESISQNLILKFNYFVRHKHRIGFSSAD